MHSRTDTVQVTNGSSVALTFDANGNMTVDELGNELTYDAWNRLVKVESGSTVLAEYAYDALTRRTLGYGLDLYYSQNWQVLEEFVTGQDAAVARYVWSIAYIDALVLRERFNSSAYDRLYVLQDANWNVTSLASLSAAIQERYIFDPYGLRTVLDASWSPLSGSAFDWVYAHQGGKLDVDAGLYSFRYRDLRPTLMRWGSMDPIRSGWNLYEYANDNPPNGLDPSGLIRIVGVIPPPQKLYIYQIEGTDRPIAPWRVGDCYTQANGRYNWVQCPATPADDPEGPSYLHGVQGLVSGYRLLLAACERCATGAGGCTKEKCRSDAADLVFRLVNAWQNNYGRGCHSAVGDPVGGHLCWDWSRIFLQAVQGLRSPCFQYQEWAASPRDPRSNYVHYYLWVGVGGGMTPECSVMFDDGFFNPRGGGTASPLHPFPRHPDWYPNDPRNVPPSQRRCPFIPLPY